MNLPKRFALSAVSLAVMSSMNVVIAQQADQSSSPAIEEIVVTGVARQGVTKLEASISVSAISDEDIQKLAPRSTAEIFRGLPGIRAESSGGGGNANITIRGIPLATGGSKYTQIHEDGLPVLEFGDINFGNTDNFIRADRTIRRIESVRGGSASTLASNSPGGIINMISKTGGDDAGSVGISAGLDYDEFRTDFEYGGTVNDTVTYHIGGFFRKGEGVRETGFDGDEGGQIKANITKELDDGYVRLYLKKINDNVTTYLPAPVTVLGGGNYGPVAGFDASSQVLHSASTASNQPFYDINGQRVPGRSIEDGIESDVTAVGLEFEKSFDNGLTLTNKFRTSSIKGGFISPFTDGFAGGTATIANKGDILCSDSSVADCSQGVSALVNGVAANPNQLAFTNLTFDTSFEDLGLTVNDLRLSWESDVVSVSGGLYYSDQSIETSWNAWHTRLQTVDGGNSQDITYIANANGEVLSDNGLLSASFLNWKWDLDYQTIAPYLNVGFDVGDNVTVDMSVRRDSVDAEGTLASACCGGNQAVDVNGNGVIDSLENPSTTSAGFIAGGIGVLDTANPGQRADYSTDHTSYSIGGTYLLGDNSSVFTRLSEGGRAIGDRLLQIGGAVKADGSLAATTDGVDSVTQFEIGYKYLGENGSFFVTAFDTETEETGAEITSGNTFERTYEATGIEIDGDYDFANGFSVAGNITWSDAEIAADRTNAAVVGNTPRRQADFIYTITPEYNADRFNVGATFQGSTDFYLQDNNDLEQKAYVLVNLFGTYHFSDKLSAFVTVNNLTDEFVLTESEEGSGAIGSFVRARPLNGRSSSVGFTYSF
ncbi:TonB-dependent receptor [Arenicella xantha]|uniref:Outer membrane receptor protein involved in Fe transport n=1 Tax=Arenicella xantha TaxID=644221 RepID=A0A395JT18_9GAMM|nr:TonB-dependent receptor [Arenicella xantha]RBP53482.1 outer membrane receptor protein involved in Fe transport [Arenicella xantha]